MSELARQQCPAPEETQEDPQTPIEASFLDDQLRSLTSQYRREAGLVNGEAFAYNNLPLHKRADTACVAWGRDPDTWERSTLLKGLVESRRILNAAQENQQKRWVKSPESYKPYAKNYHYMDYEYYRRVDRLVYKTIGRVVLENATDCQPLPVGDVDQFGLPNGRFALVRDNIIHRQLSLRPDGQPNQAFYAVYPAEYPARVTSATIV